MALKPYADLPVLRTRQVLGDLCCLLWILLWCWVGVRVHAAVSALAAPARLAQDGAAGLADQLRRAGGSAADLPLVGGDLGRSMDGAASRADALAAAGREQVTVVEDVAVLAALAVALVPAVLALALRLPARLRYARRAAAAQRLAATGNTSLLALRALVGQPPAALTRIAADPVAAWRGDDPAAVAALAALELHAVGVRAPGPPGPGPDGLSARRTGPGGRSGP